MKQKLAETIIDEVKEALIRSLIKNEKAGQTSFTIETLSNGITIGVALGLESIFSSYGDESLVKEALHDVGNTLTLIAKEFHNFKKLILKDEAANKEAEIKEMIDLSLNRIFEKAAKSE